MFDGAPWASFQLLLQTALAHQAYLGRLQNAQADYDQLFQKKSLGLGKLGAASGSSYGIAG